MADVPAFETSAPELRTSGFGSERKSEDSPSSLSDPVVSVSQNDASAPSAVALPDAPPSAATDSSSPAAATPAPSENAMVNLVNLLVAQHVITKDAGDGLIRQATQEAEAAHSQVVTTQATAERALAQTGQPADPPAAPTSDDDVKVNYVPDVVKNQIGDEVTERVLKKAHDEKWAATDPLPDWVHRFHVNGDLRVRYEGDMFPDGNAVGNFTNFNAINTSASGLNANPGAPFAPVSQFNVDQDRNRFRLRARIGAEIDLEYGFTAGLRLGTGADNSPVTENQTLGGVGGVTGGQGGNFGKYAVWLDRAFLKYEMGNPLEKDFAVSVGRFNNPFLSTSMIFSEDLGFDGAVAQAKYKLADGVTPFVTAGGFPVFNTDLNFSSTQSAKFSSEDKYLYAIQGGTNWTINKDFSLKVATAFYDFENVEGKVSSAIPVASVNDVGNTDDSRPTFAQNGNTYIALRDFEDPAPGKLSYTGSTAGIQAVAAGTTGTVGTTVFKVIYLKDTTAGSGKADPTATGATNSDPEFPNFNLSDTFQGTTPFNGKSNVTGTTINYGVLQEFNGVPNAILPLKFLANKGAPAALNNITALQVQALFTNGSEPLAFFTGNPNDEGITVYAVGRDIGSGARYLTLAESGIGSSNSGALFQNYVTLSGTTITGYTASPAGKINGISFPAGNGGYPSFSVVLTALKATSTDSVGYFITYVGGPDAVTAQSAANGAQELAWNGNLLGTATEGANNTAPVNLAEGKYTFWGYIHVHYLSSLQTSSPLAYKLAQNTYNDLGSDTLTGAVLVSDVQVTRPADGAVVTTTYF